jgi:uncharacterized protein
MTDSSHIHHEIDYIEFSVTDLERAKTFYSKVFGWEFNDYGPTYAGIKTKSKEVGGLALTAQVSSGGPLVILYSTQLEKSWANVIEAGGVITKEPFAFPGGRRFQFNDPSGNELAVWTKA